MRVKIHDTLTRGKRSLTPLEDNHVKLYVCGITSYDYCHIGHARSALVFDMVVRYLRYRGFRVTFVRNFTDIDDKIIKRAREKGAAWNELAQRFIDEFYTDMDRLGVLRPDIEPKATEHINDMIELISQLISKGLAYQSQGDVYFRVEKFGDYGRLSGRSLDDMRAGARIEVSELKEHPMDFALWKSSKPGEPQWDSPWGPGRPGWHIECSAMSRKYLGETFDIHGGGKDLIFPHHENELAQSVGANDKPFANLWIHHGFVTIRDEKMSKSLGNFLTIREVLDNYPPEVLRLFVFSTQYRNPLDFSETIMRETSSGMDRVYDCLSQVMSLAGPGDTGGASVISKKDRNKLEQLEERFQRAMDNDFNTAQALGVFFDIVKVFNKVLRMLPAEPAAADVKLLRESVEIFQRLGAILGVFQEDPVAYIAAKKEQLLASIDISEQEVKQLIAERARARAEKDWAASDAVRDRLAAHNIELRDGPEGTTWDVKI